MRIKDLEIFLDLLKTKSPTQSAERFSISQPNVSMVIKRLEKLAGFTLFERIGKKLIPTSRALFLGGMWLEVVQSYYASLKSLESASLQEFVGELNCVATPTISEHFLPKILFGFAKTYEGVKLNLKTLSVQECFESIKNGKADLALLEGEISPQYAKSQKLSIEMFYTDSLVVASNDFILASRARNLESLLDKDWVLRECDLPQCQQFLNAVAERGVEIPILLELSSMEAIKELVLHQGALSVFPQIAIKEELENKSLFAIPIKNLALEQHFYALKRENQPHNEILVKLEESILDWSKL
ncbi:LysR family transcriptional regulator [Helicobacter sp. MIT 05-5294]|uniref:LysR family transcriptional regulator n=1 Tax=Helicobacter sp. MIT 05-5294 TaxID=1548150 RepID=UPI00051F86E9|nr:LysR family transcriptional regulator [Helicobacter sp. MIT 05-5294]TLD89147.1 LysR family transcriptional regulator [Helicobacter sp. MIT 05-5294]